MANPPFNVDGVQVARIKGQVGEQQSGRLPFGLPGTTTKSRKKEAGETISNANSLWIQYFYSYLNASGRAGFVMASSASDAGNKDREIRQKLVETGHVDVMISIGSKFFYTRSLPCTLWFFDRGKPDDLLDSVLMIDARNVYTVVSPRSHVFTDEQLANLSAITWLYRGEHEKFVELIARYQHEVGQWLSAMPERLAADSVTVTALAGVLADLARRPPTPRRSPPCARSSAKRTWPDRRTAGRLPRGAGPLEARGRRLAGRCRRRSMAPTRCCRHPELSAGQQLRRPQSAASQAIEAVNPQVKAALAALEARHKAWLKLLESAEKQLRARQWPRFAGDTAREARKALLPRDLKKREAPTVRDLAVEAFRRASYFIAQGHWLLSRFPNGWYDDVPGLCKVVARKEIAANDWSLTPGRYVGSAAAIVEDDEGEGFRARMREIHGELAGLNDSAQKLGLQIQVLLAEVFA
jgi:type I restriction enzyme M protein